MSYEPNLWLQNVIAGQKADETLWIVNVENGSLSMTMSSWVNSETDSLKVETSGQGYYDLIAPTTTIDAWVQINATDAWSGVNYTVSATGGWILHPDIKRAKAIAVYGSFTQATEVKLYVSPVDNPDGNTPEFVSRFDWETEWMFRNSANQAATSPAAPAASIIVPISANALKFYIKNTGASQEVISWLRFRLFF